MIIPFFLLLLLSPPPPVFRCSMLANTLRSLSLVFISNKSEKSEELFAIPIIPSSLHRYSLWHKSPARQQFCCITSIPFTRCVFSFWMNSKVTISGIASVAGAAAADDDGDLPYNCCFITLQHDHPHMQDVLISTYVRISTNPRDFFSLLFWDCCSLQLYMYRYTTFIFYSIDKMVKFKLGE